MSQRNSGYVRQPNEEYTTPAWVVRVLLPYLPRRNCAHILDPAGPGTAIADALIAAGYDAIVSSDDFLATQTAPVGVNTIICNPPFGTGGKLACRFIEHALELVPLVAMLLRIDFDSGKTRTHLFRDHEYFTGKIVLLDRIVWFEREGAPGPSENHSWFIWDKRRRGDPPTIRYASKPMERMQRRSQSTKPDNVFLRFTEAQSRILADRENVPPPDGFPADKRGYKNE
jgi:hypothetical protein